MESLMRNLVIERLQILGGGDAGTSTTTRDTEIALNPHQSKGGGGTASISSSLLLHDVTDIASSSLRELDAVALATNVTVFMKRGTKPAGTPGLRYLQPPPA
jgi:hypothetical protein